MVDGVTVEIIVQIQQLQAEAGEHFTITTSNNYQPHLNWWGLYSPITPKKMYENFQENLLDKCNQRLMCCNQKIEQLTQELRKAKLDKIEVYKLMKAIKEVK